MIPVIIRRDVPTARVGIVTASYAATLNVGSLITSLLTAPLAGVIGWNLALLTWAALTIAGVLVWGAHLRRERRGGTGGHADLADHPFARPAPKVGRNDPCPCGSGKKFKKCCLH